MMADLAFFLATQNSDSRTRRASRRNLTPKSGRAIGCPAVQCPGGTTSFARDHSASARIGSSGYWKSSNSLSCSAAAAAAAASRSDFLRALAFALYPRSAARCLSGSL